MPVPSCIKGLLYAWMLLGGLTCLTFAGYRLFLAIGGAKEPGGREARGAGRES